MKETTKQKPVTTSDIQDTLISILFSIISTMYAHGWKPSYAWKKTMELRTMFYRTQLPKEDKPKAVIPSWSDQRLAFIKIIFMGWNSDTWPEDRWITVSEGWDMNCWRNELSWGATMYPIVHGQTKTEIGYVLL